MSTDIADFIAAHVATVQPLFHAANLAEWEVATTGSEDANQRAADLRATLMRIYANPTEYQQLRAWDAAPSTDPEVARQVRLLHLSYAQSQQDEQTIDRLTALEKDIQSAYVNFRGEYAGRRLSDNELQQLLNTETDSSKLQAAWEGSKQIGAQVVERVLAAVALRNESARRMGYANYYSQCLALNEIGEERLFGILDELERLTDEPFRRRKADLDDALAKRFGVSAGDLRPWHYGDPFFQRPPQTGSVSLDPLFADRQLEALALATFAGIGLDVRAILDRSDLYARPGKDQHAFCIHVDRAADVRILCNLVSNERWTETLLHELGHGVYDQYLDPALPYLLREPAHTLSTEAIAMLMGRLPLAEEWLREVVGVSAAELAGLGAQARSRQQLAMLIFVRWMLVMVHFERALYSGEVSDLNAHWWDLVERYQLVRRPDGRAAPDWAAKIHLALYPVYYQNYMLGELMASQLSRWLEREAGGLVNRPRAGELLRGLFALGARADWDTTLEQVTGERLNPTHFVAEFVRA